jgi:hypothetical protein
MFSNYGYDYVPNGFEREIYLVYQPNNSDERNFTIIIDFENGEAMSMQTLSFTW